MTARQQPISTAGLVATFVLMLAFGAVAVWTGSMIVTGIIDAIKLRNAVLVDARILNIDVVERSEVADAVYFTYSYDYDGETFNHRQQRLSLFSHSRELHQQLKNALNTGEVVPCYVDPDDPALSLFSLEFSIPLLLVSALFPLVFGGIALMAMVSLSIRLKAFLQQRRQTS